MNTRRPNIIVIVFDAARAEDFSILGYGKRTTPNLERHAKSLAWYTQCVSSAIWTMPSTASLFTGVYPSTHRLVIDGDRLSPRFATLAEMLKGAGYFTAIVTGQVPYLTSFTGLNRGFEHAWEPKAPWLRRMWRSRKIRGAWEAGGVGGGRGAAVGVDLGVDVAGELAMHQRRGLKARARYWMTGFVDTGAEKCFDHVRRLWREVTDRPRFVYMHLQETHSEYRPPHRYRRKFVPEHLRGRNFAAINQRPNPHAAGAVKLTDEDFEILTGLYDGCIAYLDEQVGRLLDELSREEDFNETMVVVTADHGDCIGRHGVLGHQFVCYEELARIPLVVKWPKSVGMTGAQGALVQNVDFVPTVCGMAGVERPRDCEGIDYLRGARDLAYTELLKPFGQSAIRQELHKKAAHFDRAVLAVRSRSHKLITYSNGQGDELYDLVADPREGRNLIGASGAGVGGGAALGPHGAEYARLKKAMEAWRPKWMAAVEEVKARLHSETESKGEALDPELEERLRGLGYID